ncbi:MAG TPA: cytochrome c oxidase subunit II, partial [Stellaceae bacterium]
GVWRGVLSAVPALLLPVAGCTGVQSALDPAGKGAEAIGGIWWLFFWVCTAVYVLVMLTLIWAMLRRRGGYTPFSAPEVHPNQGTEGRIRRVVGVATAVTVAILLALTLVTYATNSKLFAQSGDGAYGIELIGHQWWWEVRYQAAQPSDTFITADEIHLPVGETVKITLRSDDVIHSFWVPNLHGKKDLIPGQLNTLYLTADRPGRFRGQCAEFCGAQHAHMALDVVAEPKDAFESWLDKQRKSAKEPQTDEQKRGMQVFMSGPCAMCHAITGTPAGGVVGPNLTHLASRMSLGAGRLPNTRGNRAGWIADPQTQKPGNLMPPIVLPPDDLQALLSYLDTLD